MDNYSPAFAAGVSRKLEAAGIKRAVEIQKGVETEGYAVMLQTDCVRVEWVTGPGPWSGRDELQVVIDGLAPCEQALADSYDVERVVRPVAHPGEWRDGPVLEIRRPAP